MTEATLCKLFEVEALREDSVIHSDVFAVPVEDEDNYASEMYQRTQKVIPSFGQRPRDRVRLVANHGFITEYR